VYHPQGDMSCPLALYAALIKVCVHLLDTVFPCSSLVMRQLSANMQVWVSGSCKRYRV
jgi:hypothetical protein